MEPLLLSITAVLVRVDPARLVCAGRLTRRRPVDQGSCNLRYSIHSTRLILPHILREPARTAPARPVGSHLHRAASPNSNTTAPPRQPSPIAPRTGTDHVRRSVVPGP